MIFIDFIVWTENRIHFTIKHFNNNIVNTLETKKPQPIVE